MSRSTRPSVSPARRAARFAAASFVLALAARRCRKASFSPRRSTRPRKASTCRRKASTCPDCRRCSVSYCADNLRKASINCLSNSGHADLLHSSRQLQRRADRPPSRADQDQRARRGTTTNRSPSTLVEPDAPKSSTSSLGERLAGRPSMSRCSPVRCGPRSGSWMLPANQLHRRPASAEETEPESSCRRSAAVATPWPATRASSRPPPPYRARWYCSAFLATRREFSPSRFSSLAVNSSISLRSVSSRLPQPVAQIVPARSPSAVQFSFQPPPVPGRRVQRRDVVLALARHFEARLMQRVYDLMARFRTVPCSTRWSR